MKNTRIEEAERKIADLEERMVFLESQFGIVRLPYPQRLVDVPEPLREGLYRMKIPGAASED